MLPDEYAKLLDDVKQHGVRESIVVHEGMILDGRHRFRAAKESGRECPQRDFDPATDGESVVAWVISKNLHRRHLSTSQRAMIAAESLPMYEAEAKERQRESNRARASENPEVANLPSRRKARDEAAKSAGVSPRAVQTAKKVAKESPALAEEVKQGKKSLNAAAKEARKTAESVPAGTDAREADPVDAILAQTDFHDLVLRVRALKKDIVALAATPAGVCIHIQSVERVLTDLASLLKHNAPFKRIRDKKAIETMGREWVSELEWSRMPPEVKESADA